MPQSLITDYVVSNKLPRDALALARVPFQDFARRLSRSSFARVRVTGAVLHDCHEQLAIRLAEVEASNNEHDEEQLRAARVVMRETVRDQGATVMEGAKTALTGGHRHDNKAKEWTPSP